MANPKFSVIIPVWNGSDVILNCLKHLYENKDDSVEVICVDNASADDSCQLIEEAYPTALLIRNYVNLGFAGGINRGIDEAIGDNFILLNQDCLVQPGWLAALSNAMDAYPQAGIAGCTIYNTDGSLNHAGASIERPGAYGHHDTSDVPTEPQTVEFVTGALFLIRRSVWESVGRLDEDFYPGYYEETDYCYRAASQGHSTLLVPGATARHLLSSKEWQKEPERYISIQHQNRYRFVAKHFDEAEIDAFFTYEQRAIQHEKYPEQRMGRYLALQRIVRSITSILEKRSLDLQIPYSSVRQRQLQSGYSQLLRQLVDGFGQLNHENQQQLLYQLEVYEQNASGLANVQSAEQRYWDQLFFRQPQSKTSSWIEKIPFPKLQRLLSILTGREQHLMVALAELQNKQLAALAQADQNSFQMVQLLQNRIDILEERLARVESASDYEFR